MDKLTPVCISTEFDFKTQIANGIQMYYEKGSVDKLIEKKDSTIADLELTNRALTNYTKNLEKQIHQVLQTSIDKQDATIQFESGLIDKIKQLEIAIAELKGVTDDRH